MSSVVASRAARVWSAVALVAMLRNRAAAPPTWLQAYDVPAFQVQEDSLSISGQATPLPLATRCG